MKIYLDNAATTKVADEVYKEMSPYFTEKYGNASSVHEMGQEAKEALEKSRKAIAKLIGANCLDEFSPSIDHDQINLQAANIIWRCELPVFV